MTTRGVSEDGAGYSIDSPITSSNQEAHSLLGRSTSTSTGRSVGRKDGAHEQEFTVSPLSCCASERSGAELDGMYEQNLRLEL